MRLRLTLFLLMLAAAVPAHAQTTNPALVALQQARKDCGARLSFSRTKCLADIDKAIAALTPAPVTPPVPPVVVPPVVPPVTPPPVVTPPVVVPPVVVPPVVTPPVVTPPVVVPPVVVTSGALYISPTGSDAIGVDGSATKPFKTFAKAFGSMRSGGELVLLDGIYASNTTGCINWQNGANDGMPPSGSAGAYTLVHALNPGAVQVNCQVFLGRSDNKVTYVHIDGISVEGGTGATAFTPFNTDHVWISNGGYHSTVNDGGDVFDAGNNDGPTNTNNLYEDLWIWGKARIIAGNYQASGTTWRRVVIRGDGCSSAGCAGSGNPNVGMTVYDSQGVTVENVIILDRLLTGSGNNYADFATAQHDPGPKNGNNRWLGTWSINAPDHCYYFESDGTGPQPEATVNNAFCWKPKEVAAFQPSGGLVLNGVTTTFGSIDASGSSVSKTNIVTGATAASHAGGATGVFRYQSGVLTTTPLWPWPNEARIKAEMCATNPRGFCNDPAGLTHYVWSQLGNGTPY